MPYEVVWSYADGTFATDIIADGDKVPEKGTVEEVPLEGTTTRQVIRVTEIEAGDTEPVEDVEAVEDTTFDATEVYESPEAAYDATLESSAGPA